MPEGQAASAEHDWRVHPVDCPAGPATAWDTCDTHEHLRQGVIALRALTGRN